MDTCTLEHLRRLMMLFLRCWSVCRFGEKKKCSKDLQLTAVRPKALLLASSRYCIAFVVCTFVFQESNGLITLRLRVSNLPSNASVRLTQLPELQGELETKCSIFSHNLSAMVRRKKLTVFRWAKRSITVYLILSYRQTFVAKIKDTTIIYHTTYGYCATATIRRAPSHKPQATSDKPTRWIPPTKGVCLA